jgi:hypothetical protein
MEPPNKKDPSAPETINVSNLQKGLVSWGNTHEFKIKIKKGNNKYCFGVLPEILEKKTIYKLKKGIWNMLDYYDRQWAFLAVHENVKDTKKLKFERVTEFDDKYGYMRCDMIDEYLKLNDMKQKYDFFNDEAIGCKLKEAYIRTGNGEIDHHIYVAKNKKNKVKAFFITEPYILELMTQEEDWKIEI